MTKAEAVNFVEASFNKYFDSPESGRLVVIDSLTVERPYGWVFFVNTERFLKTKERRFAIIDGGPFIFRVSDSSIYRLQSGVPLDVAIADYEKEVETT